MTTSSASVTPSDLPSAAPHPFVYLASQSPRRRQLLAQLGVAHELLLPGPDEDAEALEAERAAEAPHDYVRRVTQAKLDAAVQRRIGRGLPPAPVLCSDTTVTLDGRILGKPADAAEALATLRALSGRRHEVMTAVAIHDGVRTHAAVCVSGVWMAPLPERLLHNYVASGEPFGKAGAYAIQSALAGWIARIDGSHSGIMGLPLHETSQLLLQAGVQVPLAL